MRLHHRRARAHSGRFDEETVAAVLGDEMAMDEEAASHMRTFVFAARGIPMPETNLKQAMIPTRGESATQPARDCPHGGVRDRRTGKPS